jgi:hypothetical protein
MDETELKAKWIDFAKRLRPVGMRIFGGASVTITDQGKDDIRLIGLMLLARTLSNLKAAIALTEIGCIVEAKAIARCCFENWYWVGALVKEGDKFREAMVQHEMKHKRMRAQTLFATTRGLKGEIGEKLRQWMRDHKQYEEAPTFDPKEVCERADNKSYVFYQHLSWDTHPSIETLNRYYDQPDENGAPGINVEPVINDAEVIEMLNLMCLAVIGVFFGVAELLGQANAPISRMAAEYQEVSKQTSPNPETNC